MDIEVWMEHGRKPKNRKNMDKVILHYMVDGATYKGKKDGKFRLAVLF